MSDTIATGDWDKILKYLEPEPPKYCPNTPFVKQKVFLRYEGIEALYGGRAGGGKSDALLMAALQYVHIPGYAAIIFRNTFADLDLPEAIMDRSHKWMDELEGPRWQSQKHTWIFPSGATLTFGYLEKPNDHLRYKGMEVQYIGYDEVTEIRREHYTYLFSRLRKPSSAKSMALAQVPLRVRCASNPAPNWVRTRFIEQGKADGRLYVPAGLDDNPFVNKEDYLTALERLDPVDRARLQMGDWYAEDEGAKFRREWFPIIRSDQLPDSAFEHTVRYWDLAATEKTEHNDPDFTAGALVSLVDGYLIIHDIQHFRANPKGVEERIAHTARVDGPSVPIRMEQEPGATGKMTIDHYARFVLLGYDFDGHLAARTGKGKEGRINNWAGKAGRKEVLLSQGNWIGEFLDEAVAYGVTSDVHDDQLDAISGAFEFLTDLGNPPKRKIQIIV